MVAGGIQRQRSAAARSMQRNVSCWLALATLLAVSLAPSTVRAEDVPFKWMGNGNFDGVAKLENGHLSGNFQASSGSASIAGEISNGKLSVNISGNLGAKAGDCHGSGSATPAPGPVNVQVSVNCRHGWSGTLVLQMPPDTAQPLSPANAAIQYPLDPIDESYVAVQPAK